MRLIEGIERDQDGLPVGDREDDQHDREGHQDQRRDELADHERAFPWFVIPGCGHARLPPGRPRRKEKGAKLPAQPKIPGWPGHRRLRDQYHAGPDGRLRRSRISLPGLKNGTDFFSTETWAPVRGLRPVRAGRFFTEKAPKPRSSTRSPRAIAATISLRIALTMFSTSR